MTYNPTVRIGNWFEDIQLEKEKIASFIKKRKNGKLLVQHTRRLFNNLLRETYLSRNKDGFVKFGSCIQLKAPDMPSSPPLIANDNRSNYGVVIAGTVHDKRINEMSSLISDCQLVASPILAPCIRNSFVIKSADNNEKTDGNLLFGQEFSLQIVDPLGGEALYVRAEKPLVDGPHGPLDHDPVRLSNNKDRYSTWKVLYWDNNMRMETEGAPFPPFTRVVVRNCMTGVNLAVEGTVWWLSIFGNECGLSAHTYVDISKRETAECLWMFVTDSNESSHDETC